MNEIVKLCGAAVLTLAATLILKDSRAPHPEIAVLFFGILVLSRLIFNIGDVVEYLKKISEGTAAESYLTTLLKAAGIAYLADLTADMCRNSGEHGIASYVEIAGKTELIILALPLMSELLDLAVGMLNV